MGQDCQNAVNKHLPYRVLTSIGEHLLMVPKRQCIPPLLWTLTRTSFKDSKGLRHPLNVHRRLGGVENCCIGLRFACPSWRSECNHSCLCIWGWFNKLIWLCDCGLLICSYTIQMWCWEPMVSDFIIRDILWIAIWDSAWCDVYDGDSNTPFST